MKKTRDGFGELARAFGIGHCESEAAGQAMACHAVFLEKVRSPSESVLGKNRIAKTGFDEALDSFGVVGLHDDARCDANLFKIAIDNEADVAAFRIEEKGRVSKFRSTHRTDVAAADFVGGGTHDEELLVKKRNELEVGFGDRERNKSEVETAVEQTGNHLFSDTNSDANFGVGILFAEFAERAS